MNPKDGKGFRKQPGPVARNTLEYRNKVQNVRRNMNDICRQGPVENSREAIKKGKMGSHLFFLSDEARTVKEEAYK